MARTYLVFGDIEGKLDVLRVECTKCDRRARPGVKLNDWRRPGLGYAVYATVRESRKLANNTST